jgi:excisionase family DNA binding protein
MSLQIIDHVPPNERFMNYRALAQYLGISESHVRQMVMQRILPFYKFGGGKMSPVRFRRSEIDQWVNSHHVPSREA